MNFLDNITFRRNRTKSDTMMNKTDSEMSKSFEETNNSVTLDLSDDDVTENNKLKKRIEELEAELKNALMEINILSLENTRLRVCNEELKNNNDLHNDKPTPTKNDCKKKSRKSLEQSPVMPKKICLLSCNKQNNMLHIARNSIKNYSEICHYLTPNGNTEELLSGIDKKLTGFTLNDYCIIMIGDEDFRKTRDYISMIYLIRESLKLIVHTNIIICLPTYKCGPLKNMFNWRVESFNNLLYLDVMTHKHAYILNSNKNINYDYSMFRRHIGIINDRGMYTIFENLNNLITDIEFYNHNNKEQLISNSHDEVPSTENESIFFRN
ncbi:hypothetical protein ABMA27_010376 [Loxostege sticticalis]|uniref:Uncharacterized protein n=1 Tax=Loxostege sticticalis TaxID=481309 RepID=A0ABR3H5H5_LOXSC